MKTIVLVLLCIAFVFNSFAQNLITNPGAESDPVANGWTIVTQGTNCSGSLNWRIQGNQSGYPAAAEGNYLFYSGCGSIDGEIYQDVNVSSNAATIDAGLQSFSFSGYMRVFNQSPSDSSRMVVEYRSNTSVVLTKYDAGFKGDRTAWVNYNSTLIAPAGTRTIRVRLLSKNVNGSSVDAYFDNLSLTTLTVLPVSLINFIAEVENKNQVKLSWQTTAEVNHSKFTIERSANAVDWISVKELYSKTGNSSALQNYSAMDYTPLQQTSYYRLKQTDLNGIHSYSKIIPVSIKVGGVINIYPNPAKDFINVTGSEGLPKNIRVFNIYGQEVTNTTTVENQGQEKIILNINKLQKGQYILKTETLTAKFTKL